MTDIVHAIDSPSMLEGLRSGTPEAWTRLVESYSGRLTNVIIRYVRDAHLAEDVLQNTWVSVHRSIGSFAGDSRLSTWLHRIAVNAALMVLRTRKRKFAANLTDIGDEFDLASDRRGPEEESAELEDWVLVRRAIGRMSGRAGVALRLYASGVPISKAAEALGCSVRAVRKELRRAGVRLGRSSSYSRRVPMSESSDLGAAENFAARVLRALAVGMEAAAAALSGPGGQATELPTLPPPSGTASGAPEGANPSRLEGRAEGAAARRSGLARESNPYAGKSRGIVGAKRIGWDEGYDSES